MTADKMTVDKMTASTMTANKMTANKMTVSKMTPKMPNYNPGKIYSIGSRSLFGRRSRPKVSKKGPKNF